jgi:hypothetical protein
MADVEEVEVVVAHRERATLRVGDVFLTCTPGSSGVLDPTRARGQLFAWRSIRACAAAW